MSKSHAPKQPRTPAQIAASRANGAQSLGPTTPEGKTKISKNRMSHGFRSSSIVLSNEDRQAYDEHLDAYLRRYAPTDKVEADLVGLLASNMWHIMRNNSIELALFEIEISGIDADIEGKYESMDQYGRLALAFKKSAGDGALELLRRYKSTSERAYHRALQALEDMRKNRESQPPAPPQEDFSAVQTRPHSQIPTNPGLILVPDSPPAPNSARNRASTTKTTPPATD